MVNRKTVTNKIEIKQLNWFGHITRMSTNSVTKRIEEAKRPYKRIKGRTKKSKLKHLRDLYGGRQYICSITVGMISNLEKKYSRDFDI